MPIIKYESLPIIKYERFIETATDARGIRKIYTALISLKKKKNMSEVVPEGVESIVPFKGPASDIVNQLVGGLKSGMSYTDSHTIAELQKNVEFVRITNAGQIESASHDVKAIT